MMATPRPEVSGRLEAPKVVLGPDRLAGGMRSLGETGGEGGLGEDGVGEDGAGEDVTDDGEAWSPEVQRRVNRERGRG